MSLFLQLLGNGIVQGAVAACLAAGFGFVYRSFRVFHIALGGQFIFSCYMFYLFGAVLHLPMLAAAAVSLALSVLFAWGIELVVYRPFLRKGVSSGATMIASLGIMIVVENALALAFGNEFKTISTQLEPSVAFCGLRFTRIQLLQFFCSAAAFGLTGVLVQRSDWFKAIWAMGDQPELIPVLGLPLNLLRLIVMSLCGLMVAMSALLLSYDIGMDPHVGMHYLLLASVAVFFGGTDRYWAWGAGAMAITVLQSLAVWRFSARWTDLVTFGVLICVLLLKPQGIFGTRKRLEEQGS